MSRPDRASTLYRRAFDRLPDESGPVAGEQDHPPDGRGSADRARAGGRVPGAGMLAIALLGLVLGLSATALVLARDWDPGDVVVGPWSARSRVGTPAIDPYAEAALARRGAMALAANEGLRFTATIDDTGYRLLANCSYRVGGTMPPARFWTLTATGVAGDAVQGRAAALRSAFSSTTVIRDLAGRAAIDLAPTARPGNWLPLAGRGPLTLTLTLYDTPLADRPADVATAGLPSIVRLGCAASEDQR